MTHLGRNSRLWPAKWKAQADAQLKAPRAAMGSTADIRTRPLALWFAGLRLASVDRMIGSRAKVWQTNAKFESRQAARVVFQEMRTAWQFLGPVDLVVRQVLPAGVKKKDADNLWAKHLIDTLGPTCLAIIGDDDPAHVRKVTKWTDPKPGELGVEVMIIPVQEVPPCRP